MVKEAKRARRGGAQGRCRGDRGAQRGVQPHRRRAPLPDDAGAARPRSPEERLADTKEPILNQIHEHVMAPKSGHALEVRKGQHLRITDLEGQQVVDVAVFNADNHREKLSTSNSRTRYVPPPGQDYVPRDHLSEGDTLMSTLCRPMMTIVRDTPEPKGIHDTHNRMCNRFLFESHGAEVAGRLPRDHQQGRRALRDPARGHPGHARRLHELPAQLREAPLGDPAAGVEAGRLHRVPRRDGLPRRASRTAPRTGSPTATRATARR